MANRFWVGGSATWDATAGVKWSTTSGGAGGAAVPTSADDVFFNAASGAVTCTLSGTRNCRHLDFTGFTGTFAGTGSLQVHGNLKLVAGMTHTITASYRFQGALANTVTTAGKSLSNPNFGADAASTGSWTLQDAFTTASTFRITSGTLNSNNQTISASSLAASGGTVNLSASTVTVTSFNPIDIGSGVTLNAGTSTVNVNGGGGINANGKTFHNMVLSSTARTLNSDLVISGILTNTGTSASSRATLGSNTTGTARTLTAAVVALQDVDFRDTAGAGAAAPFAGTRLGNLGNNSGITFTAAANKYYVGDTANWEGNVWALASGGAAAVNNFPLPQDTAIFDAGSFSADGQTVTIDSPKLCTILCSGTDQTYNLTINGAPEIYGSITLDANCTPAGAGLLQFNTNGVHHVITSAGKTWTMQFGLTCRGGGSWKPADAWTSSSTLSLNAGTLDLNGQTVIFSTFSVFGSGVPQTLKSSVNGGVFQSSTTAAATAFTFNSADLTVDRASGTWEIKVGGNTANTRTFSSTGYTFPKLTFTNTTAGGRLDITGSNTFKALQVAAPPQSIMFTAGTTTTIEDGDAGGFPSGTAGNLVTIGSITAASHTLAKSGGGFIDSEYLSISRSTATPASSWYAGLNSTDGGNNSGWLFIDPPVLVAGTGSFALNGQAVDFRVGPTIMAADFGTFALNGQAVLFDVQRRLEAAHGSFALNGQNVELLLPAYMDVNAALCWLLELEAFPLAPLPAGHPGGAFSEAAYSESSIGEGEGGTEGAPRTLHYSDRGYISHGSDTPAWTWYDGRLALDIDIDRRIHGRGALFGLTRVFASVSLVNNDGALDTLKRDYAIEGRSAKLLVGRDTDPRARFATVFSGVVHRLSVGGRVRLQLSDGVARLDRPLNLTTYAGTGGNEGGADIKGKYKPKVYGKAHNAPAPLVDSANLVYQVHDGALQDVPAGYDRGIALVKVGGAPAAGQYQVTAAAGTVKLGATPAGTVTFDVEGDATGSYVEKTGDIVKRILEVDAALTAGEINDASITQLNTDAPGEVGIWSGPEGRSLGEVINELLIGVGAFGGFARTGEFTVGRVALPVGALAATYTESEILDVEQLPLPDLVDPIIWRAAVGYQRNYTVQNDLAAGVTAARRTFAAEQLRVEEADDVAIKSRHLLATEFGPVGNFRDQADASAEAVRLLALWGEQRGLFKVTLPLMALGRELNESVLIRYPRYGLQDGVEGRVLGFALRQSRVELMVLT